MTAFEEAKRILAGRLTTRARYWAAKAKEARRKGKKQEDIDHSIRAVEAENCAQIARELSGNYVAPPKPDMAAARASRKRKKEPR